MNKILEYLSGLKGKILIIFSIFFTIGAMLYGIIMYATTKPELIGRNTQELSNNVHLVVSLTRMYVKSTIETHLETMAKSNYRLAEYQYKRYRNGEISEAEAKNTFKQVLLDPVYGKIGDTGYLAGVNSKGVLVMHPVSEGVDASSFEFMKEAMAKKNGPTEYLWKNKNETKERPKTGYLAYFEPWDLMIWPSSYREEFLSLIHLEGLEEIINDIKIGANGYAYIINSKGEMVVHPDMSELNENAETSKNVMAMTDKKGSFYFQEMINSAVALPDKSHTRYYPGELVKNSGKNDYFAVYRYIPELDWIVVASAPTREITKILHRMAFIICIVIIISVLMVMIVVSQIFGRILHPVTLIRKISASVSAGNLEGRLEVTSKDEIGVIAGQFNNIINKFEELVMKIKNSAGQLLDSVQELSVSSQEIASTSNQQAAAVKEIVTTMEDSDQLSRSIETKINEVSRISNNTKNEVNNGFSIINQTLSKMNEIKEANTGTITGIKLLSDKIDSIWDIVNIINNIADQTKIIAFNAELEASAAGEAGKNFQIVATEIRRLADSTVSSTTEIKTKINEIQHSSDKLIITSEDGTGKIREGWELSNNLQKVFEDILSSSDISATSANQITLSVKQQVSAFEQILLTLKQISEGIDNFVISTKSTSKAADDLRRLANNLTGTIENYKVGGTVQDGK